VHCFSSPFDHTAIDFLEKLDAPAYKIASFEIVDLPLIAKAASTGKPLIISTGMSNSDEIADALVTARNAGAAGVVLLHCVSGYPTPPSEANLARIGLLRGRHGCAIGLSDHTLGVEVAIASVALGACVIEKHVTLKRADGGPDAAFSLEPAELKQLCDGARIAASAIGRAEYDKAASEADNVVFRRSLYVVADIKSGDAFTTVNVRSIRPGHGLPPKLLPNIIGRRAARDIVRGTPLSMDLIATQEKAR
jgi:N-acetylneuraminate synthase